MWLQLTLAVGTAHADEVQGRVDVYRDPWVTVVIPAAAATLERTKATVAGSATLDFVSGATPVLLADTVSSATWFGDRRVAGELSATWHPKTTWSAGAAVTASTERDFASESASLNGSVDVADRRVTLAGVLTGGHERAWPSTGGPAESSGFGQADLRATGILDKNTTVTGFATGRIEQCGPTLGCQASPYRYVAYVEEGSPILTAPERHPGDRERAAGAVRLSRAFGDWTALHATYRLYGDSWGVIGHTGQLAAARQLFAEHLLLRAEARAGWQGPATFWEEQYAADLEDPAYTAWRTVDGELSGFRELAIDGRTAYSFFDVGKLSKLTLDLRGAGFWFHYPNFPSRPDRVAYLVGGGLGASF